MVSEKNNQISALNDALRSYQLSDYKRRESSKLKSMSEIRTSRIDYKSGKESLIPSETMYTSRNHMSSSKMDTYHS